MSHHVWLNAKTLNLLTAGNDRNNDNDVGQGPSHWEIAMLNCRNGCALALVLLLSGIWPGTSAQAQIGTAQTGTALSPAPQALPRTWGTLWDVSWRRAAFYYPIEAAASTLQEPACQGNLGLDVLVKNTITAVSLKKYGDATRFMGQFQDKSLCLTRDGARGVEFALSMFVHRAVTTLPPQQAQIAVLGVMNLGLQSFDQLQYTGRSWWLMMVSIDYTSIQKYVAAYPRGELGLWMYDFRRGMLVQSGLVNGMDDVLFSMQNLNNFGNGSCMLLDMSSNGFVCPDDAGAGSNGKGGAAGLEPPGGIPASGAMCVLDSVRASGVRGKFACMSRAIAGVVFDPRTAGADLAKQASQQPGIKDKFCALSDGTDASAAGDTTNTEPSSWQKFKDGTGKALGFAADLVVGMFDTTPAIFAEFAQFLKPEGADAIRGGLQGYQALRTRQRGALFEDDKMPDYYNERDRRVTTNPQANQGRTVNDPMNPGSCGGKGSNAAARAKSLYACTMGSDMTARQPPGMGGVKNPGGQGPTPNPLIAMIDPDQAAGPMPGAMACTMQSGDLARNGPNDPRCAAMSCVQGQACPCNRGGLVGKQPMEMKPAAPKAGPECADGPCAPAPTTSGGVRGGGTGPAPLPTVGPLPKGPTQGPAPGPAPQPVPPR